ncbi:unnamed protein product [Gongylonema pulchrum]|uniref:PEROXIDASE_4 domain-containing protein n=1 Tax=Gongylonema pulchrum TaxID=637853 RepID=A0A183F046_9BILA|nr:unnamed protein product [Gongylonema pulchrum]
MVRKDDMDRYVCEWENGPIMPNMIFQLENFLRYNAKREETSITGLISGRFNCPAMNEAAGLGTNLENFLRYNAKREETSITGLISGRFNCPAMNEAAGLGTNVDFSSFEFHLGLTYEFEGALGILGV